jgi:lysophospholipase L1-like esterase
MGGWISFQQFIGLQLWGSAFDPDWVVVMDGFNDAGVGCAFSQGPGNPMFFAAMRSYINGYLMSTYNPVFYRGWLENEIIKHSAAYRTVTGRTYVPDDQAFDETSAERAVMRRQILPTKIGQAREMLDFYLESERAMLKLFPRAGYILSTQPIVNQIAADFTNIYDDPPGSEAQRAATAKREADVEGYLAQYEDQPCLQKTQHPAYVYILVNGAIRLERLVADEARRGRDVEYANAGLLFPKERTDRIPFFIDSVHMSDAGYDLVARFYADKILQRAANRN